MPGNILSADTQFPNFAGQESPAEQIRTIRNYLYMLLEQLRYTLNNLDAGNFNTEGLKEIQDAISQPILKQLSDTDGNLAELQVTAAGLASRVSSNEGNISQLEQTAQGLSSRVGDAEGNISSLQQTANGLSSRVTSAEGNISTIQQTANGLSSRVSNAEGSISSLSQTASGLETRVARGRFYGEPEGERRDRHDRVRTNLLGGRPDRHVIERQQLHGDWGEWPRSVDQRYD